MRIKSIEINQFRAYGAHVHIDLGQITVLTGANNAGKSTILKGLHLLQAGSGVTSQDVRLGANEFAISYELEDPHTHFKSELVAGKLTVTLGAGQRRFLSIGETRQIDVDEIPNTEPKHFVLPFLSARKTSGYNEDTRAQNTKQIATNFHNLPAKISRISNSTYPHHGAYKTACEEILGYPVFTIPSENGHQIGIYTDQDSTISITQMGDGVPHILGLLADLATAKNKLFLIEEPENDLHPSALKALLDLIIVSSKSNQFVISTHSNIVVTYLAGLEDSRLYRVHRKSGVWPPEASIDKVGASPADRTAVLRELGYSFSDFDLWEGWLILEESSAERIIRNYLIPWFAPKLKRVRLVSAGGISEVGPTTNEFNRLVRFTHLESAYKNRVWVRMDGDAPGKKVSSELKQRYTSWQANQIECFDQPQFERYYPHCFKEKVETALSNSDPQARRESKKELLLEVIDWLDVEPARAQLALKESAASVISDLQRIADSLQ